MRRVTPSFAQAALASPTKRYVAEVNCTSLKDLLSSCQKQLVESKLRGFECRKLFLVDERGRREEITSKTLDRVCEEVELFGLIADMAAGTVEADAQGLLSWLEKNPIDTSSLQAFREWIDSAPVPQLTKQFFKHRTFEVPDLDDKCILGTTFRGEKAVIRTDIEELLARLAKLYSIVVLASARCTGKSVGCLHSLMSVRQKVLTKADRLVVLASGHDLPVQNIKTIMCISMFCGLPMILDNMHDLDGFARGIKTFVEDLAFRNCPSPPLSVVVLGSDMTAIHEAAVIALGGLEGQGVSPVTLVPAPSLGLVLTMLQHRRTTAKDNELTDEFAAKVLNALTMSGPNLAQHWSVEEPPSAIAVMSVAKIRYLPAELSHVITRINHGSAIGQDVDSLIKLAEFGYIRPRVVAGKAKAYMYDYVDYRLITYQEFLKLPMNSDVSDGVMLAEGRVLEEVEAWNDKRLVTYYGPLGSGGSEVDLLLVEKVPVTDDERPCCNLYLCSAKRSESQQDLSSFVQHTKWLYKFSEQLQQQLPGAQQLTFVAISCIPDKNSIAHVQSQLPVACTLPLDAPSQQQPQEGPAAVAGGSKKKQKQGLSSGSKTTAVAPDQDESSSNSSGGSSRMTAVVAVAQHQDGSTAAAANRATRWQQQPDSSCL